MQKVGLPLVEEQQNEAGAIPPHVCIEHVYVYSAYDGYSEPYDVTEVATELEITESINSLAVVGSLSIIDNFTFFQDARIQGQEKIVVKFRRYNPEMDGQSQYTGSLEREFLVTNITNYKRQQFRVAFTFEFASPHVYADKVKRIGRAYGFTDVTAPAADISGSVEALQEWRNKYTIENTSEENYIWYDSLSDLFWGSGGFTSDDDLYGFSRSNEPNKMEYPEEMIYNILRKDLEIPKERIWFYGKHPQLATNKRTSANRMKVVIPNWRPLQAIKWLLRNTFSEKENRVGHPWFCYDTLLAGIRIEPYEMLIKSPAEGGGGPNQVELYSTGRTSKKMNYTFVYSSFFNPDPTLETYYEDMNRKILDMNFEFGFDKFTQAGDGSFSTQEWYVDIATKFVFPNLYKLLDESRISYDENVFDTRNRGSIFEDHTLPYSTNVGENAIDFQKTNYTYFVPYNTTLHGQTNNTFPYNYAFGVEIESLLAGDIALGNRLSPIPSSEGEEPPNIVREVQFQPNAGGSPTKISQTGIDLIKEFEGLELKAYPDAVGVWTIGYGHTKTAVPGMVITEGEAEYLLKQDLVIFERCVQRYITVPLTQNQFDALVSFSFNLGCGSLQESTLRKKLNAGDYNGAANEFPRWNKAGGKVLRGLVRRREAERALFMGDGYIPSPPGDAPPIDELPPGEGGPEPITRANEINPEELGKIGRTGDMIRRNMEFMTHTIKVLGDFRLNPGMTLEIEVQRAVDPQLQIEGLKEPLDGNDVKDEYISGDYFVTEATHVFSEKNFHTFATICRDSSSLPLNE